VSEYLSFTKHPASVGETYSQHLCRALTFAMTMGAACVVCSVHALFPFLFEKTGSRLIERLYTDMVVQRDRRTSYVR